MPASPTMANQGPLALAPEIDEFRQQFEQISADADALVTPLCDEQFSWKARPAIWSIAECLEHMNATAQSVSASHRRGHCRRHQTRRLRRGTVSLQPHRSFSLSPHGTARSGSACARHRQTTRPATSQAGDARRIPRIPGAIHRPVAASQRDRPHTVVRAIAACVVDPDTVLGRRSRRWPLTRGGTCGRRARSRGWTGFLPETHRL